MSSLPLSDYGMLGESIVWPPGFVAVQRMPGGDSLHAHACSSSTQAEAAWTAHNTHSGCPLRQLSLRLLCLRSLSLSAAGSAAHGETWIIRNDVNAQKEELQRQK